MIKTNLLGILSTVRHEVTGNLAKAPLPVRGETVPGFASQRLLTLVGELRPVAVAYADPARPRLLLLNPERPSFTVLNGLRANLPPRDK